MTARSTLPNLLATLPFNGHHALVQPASWVGKYPNSFYKITRTNLRFKPVIASPEEEVAALKSKGSTSKAGAKGKGGAADKGKGKEVAKVDPSTIEYGDETTLTPHGKVWGVLFWNGRPTLPGHARSKHPLFPTISSLPTFPPSPSSTTTSSTPSSPDLSSLPPIPESRIRTSLKLDWAPVSIESLEQELKSIVEKVEGEAAGMAAKKVKGVGMRGARFV